MKLLSLLTFAGPFLVKGTSKRQRRKYALLSGAYLLLLASAILFCIAAFIRISSMYGADIACLSLCAFFTLVAIGARAAVPVKGMKWVLFISLSATIILGIVFMIVFRIT